jgi:methylmalonyl-CoA/ethylmalonyl-CoA epimerase
MDAKYADMAEPAEKPAGEKQIGQILVPVRDLQSAVAFYRDVLGMKFSFEIANAAFFDCGGVRLVLEAQEDPGPTKPGTMVYYRVDDIRAEYEQLLSLGVPFEGEPHCVARKDDLEIWICTLRDPEGNSLGLMSELPNHRS